MVNKEAMTTTADVFGDPLDSSRPLAIILIGGDEALGPMAFNVFGSLYSKDFPQVLFVSIGVMDQTVLDVGSSGRGDFKGTEEAKRLRARTLESLQPFVKNARNHGLKAALRVDVAVDAAKGIDDLSDTLAAEYPKGVYFLSKMVFQRPRWFHRLLHRSTSDDIRKRLERKGFPVTVIPIVIGG